MRPYVIFFNEKEGTSVQVRHLRHIPGVHVLRAGEKGGNEPFDRHFVGPAPHDDFIRCLDMVFDRDHDDMDALNALYSRTAKHPLDPIDKSGAWGLKMRAEAPWSPVLSEGAWRLTGQPLKRLLRSQGRKRLRASLLDLCARHGVVVFLAVRQDIFRWALSKYHGDGTGRPGHLQFKLAWNHITHDDIPAIRVTPWRLELLLRECEYRHREKRTIAAQCRQRGVDVYPMIYEDYMKDKHAYFARFCRRVGVDIAPEALDEALAQDSFFKKVHSEDISEWVLNHEEIMEKFGERYMPWNDTEAEPAVAPILPTPDPEN